jgi:hypothetical protein
MGTVAWWAATLRHRFNSPRWVILVGLPESAAGRSRVNR